MKRLGEPPYICLITSGRSNPSNFKTEKPKILETVRDAIEDGVNLVQIREKDLPARLLFELAIEVAEASRPTDAMLVVNDRVDVAVAAGIGVHLPESSLSTLIVRNRFPEELVIGVSTHSYSSAKTAADAEADYVFFGPVFDTPGKGEPAGAAALEEVCRELAGFPVIALGGIDETNVEIVRQAGAAGIAAIRSMYDPGSRRKICRFFLP